MDHRTPTVLSSLIRDFLCLADRYLLLNYQIEASGFGMTRNARLIENSQLGS
jgi:hypothetical protein